MNTHRAVESQEAGRRFGDLSFSSRAVKHVMKLYMFNMLLLLLLLLSMEAIDVMFRNSTIHEMFQSGKNRALILQRNLASLCILLMT